MKYEIDDIKSPNTKFKYFNIQNVNLNMLNDG